MKGAFAKQAHLNITIVFQQSKVVYWFYTKTVLTRPISLRKFNEWISTDISKYGRTTRKNRKIVPNCEPISRFFLLTWHFQPGCTNWKLFWPFIWLKAEKDSWRLKQKSSKIMFAKATLLHETCNLKNGNSFTHPMLLLSPSNAVKSTTDTRRMKRWDSNWRKIQLDECTLQRECLRLQLPIPRALWLTCAFIQRNDNFWPWKARRLQEVVRRRKKTLTSSLKAACSAPVEEKLLWLKNMRSAMQLWIGCFYCTIFYIKRRTKEWWMNLEPNARRGYKIQTMFLEYFMHCNRWSPSSYKAVTIKWNEFAIPAAQGLRFNEQLVRQGYYRSREIIANHYNWVVFVCL